MPTSHKGGLCVTLWGQLQNFEGLIADRRGGTVEELLSDIRLIRKSYYVIRLGMVAISHDAQFCPCLGQH